MPNMSDLNRRLAKWAGFYESSGPSLWWMRPNRTIYGRNHPDFTHSLDLCFKWLEPELFKQGYRYCLQQRQLPGVGEGHQMDLRIYGGDGRSFREFSGFDKEPAMAFCNAVGKLMEAKDG